MLAGERNEIPDLSQDCFIMVVWCLTIMGIHALDRLLREIPSEIQDSAGSFDLPKMTAGITGICCEGDRVYTGVSSGRVRRGEFSLMVMYVVR